MLGFVPPLKAHDELMIFLTRRNMLCDSLVNIYPDPFQTAYQRSRVTWLPAPGAEDRMQLPVGVVQNNPVVTAAAWTAQARLLLPAMPTCAHTAKQNVRDRVRRRRQPLELLHEGSRLKCSNLEAVQSAPAGLTRLATLRQEGGGSEAAVQNAMQRAQQRILMADDEFIAATAPRPAGPGRPAGRGRRVPIYESDVRVLLLLTISAANDPAKHADLIP